MLLEPWLSSHRRRQQQQHCHNQQQHHPPQQQHSSGASVLRPYRHLAAGVALLLTILLLMQLSLSITPLAVSQSTQHMLPQLLEQRQQQQQQESSSVLTSFASFSSRHANATTLQSIEADVQLWLRRRELVEARTCPKVKQVRYIKFKTFNPQSLTKFSLLPILSLCLKERPSGRRAICRRRKRQSELASSSTTSA